MVSHQDRRRTIIQKIVETLKALQARETIWNKETEDRLICEICREYNSSYRMSKEYIKIAREHLKTPNQAVTDILNAEPVI